MPKHNNPPAFPCEALVPNNTAIQFKRRFSGMTLRDWFAGQALMGMLAGRLEIEDVAESAYLVANAMLAEREKYNDQD